MKRLAQFFQEDNGNLSSTRLLFVFWGLGGFFVWVVMSLRQSPPIFVPLPWEYIGVVCTLGGVKVFQKYGEEKPK